MAAAERLRESEYRAHSLPSSRSLHRGDTLRAPSIPVKTTPVVRTVKTQSPRMLSGEVGLMLILFAFMAVGGLTFLTGYSRQAQETWKARSLSTQLNQTRALNQILKQELTIRESESNIAQQAGQRGMKLLSDQTVVSAVAEKTIGGQIAASSEIR